MVASISVSIAVDAGFGQKIAVIPPISRADAGHKTITMASIIVWSFTFPKLAVVALLHRLITPKRWLVIVMYTSVAILIFGSAVISIFWFVQCKPVARGWNQQLPGTCWSPLIVYYISVVHSSISAAEDMFLALYPIWVISRLQMAPVKKAAASLSLGLGVIAAVTIIYKVTVLNGISEELKVEPTYAPVPIVVWTAVEINTLVMAANIPTLSPLGRYIRQRFGILAAEVLPSTMQRQTSVYYKMKEPVNNRAGPSSSERPLQEIAGGVPLREIETGNGRINDIDERNNVYKKVDVTVEYERDKDLRVQDLDFEPGGRAL